MGIVNVTFLLVSHQFFLSMEEEEEYWEETAIVVSGGSSLRPLGALFFSFALSLGEAERVGERFEM